MRKNLTHRASGLGGGGPDGLDAVTGSWLELGDRVEERVDDAARRQRDRQGLCVGEEERGSAMSDAWACRCEQLDACAHAQATARQTQRSGRRHTTGGGASLSERPPRPLVGARADSLAIAPRTHDNSMNA